jgi:hypothetical protein
MSKYIDEPKYLQSVNSLDEQSKYQNCHQMDDQIKQHYIPNNPSVVTASSIVTGCHSDNDNDSTTTTTTTLIKSEDGASYVLPPFLH